MDDDAEEIRLSVLSTPVAKMVDVTFVCDAVILIPVQLLLTLPEIAPF